MAEVVCPNCGSDDYEPDSIYACNECGYDHDDYSLWDEVVDCFV